MVVKSKTDTWVGVLLTATGLVSLVTAAHIISEGWLMALLVGLPVLALGALLPCWILWRTEYRFCPEVLIVQSGPLRWKVAYSEIRKVERGPNLLAGPALSMDRITIEYGPWRQLVVSPEGPERFIEELETRRSRA